MPSYNHEKIPEVLEAFEILLNVSTALDFCGVSGKDRTLILNDPDFKRESKKIKAGKYIEEINDINEVIKSLGRQREDDNARIGESDEDPTKIIKLKMSATTLRREMLSLSANDKETEETESMNIFFIDVTREEFERLMNVEIHDGDSNSRLTGDEKEAPMIAASRRKDESRKKTQLPAEMQKNVIEYTDAKGNKIIEEVFE